MKNILLPNIQPAAPNRMNAASQAPSQAPANNTAQAAEPFNKVLARQNASTKEHNAKEQGADAGGSPQASSSSADGASSTGSPPSPDGASASSLPATDSTSSAIAEGSKKPVELQVQTLDAASAPMLGDMLAALMPAVSPMQPGAAAAGAAKSQAGELGALEHTRGSVKGQIIPALFRPEGKATLSATTADAASLVQGNTFAAALETLGKDAANMMLSGNGAAQISMQALQAAQPDAATAMVSLVQAGALPVIASTNGPAQAVINTPVSSSAWGDEFNQKVTWLATQNEQSAELHLNPPHLGPLDVVIKVSGDQATALFTSQHAAVRDAVEQALPKLREILADNGIMLGNAMVSDQSPKEQQRWDGSLSGKDGRAAETTPAGNLQAGSMAGPVRRHQGMVDTFA